MANGQSNTTRTNPDATSGANDVNLQPPAGHSGAFKTVGGGLEAGSTDTGPSTAPMQGGRGGAGTDAARTTEGALEPSGEGMSGAGGNSVRNTGRPMQPDARRGIGGEPAPGADRPGAANPADPRARPVDITEPAAGAPNFVGHERGQSPRSTADEPHQRSGMKKAAEDADR